MRRTSASVVLTVTKLPFELTIEGATRYYEAAAFKPMVKRVLRADNVGLVGFQFDPSHPVFPRFRKITGAGVLPLNRAIFNKFDKQLKAAYEGSLTIVDAAELFDGVAMVSLPHFPKARAIDKRIAKTIELLWQNYNWPLGELAAAVGLSYYRLSRLFADNMGMTLRNYQQWRKIRRAISLSKQGLPMAQLARESGFTDAAHFSRVFLQHHAAPPSYFFQNDNVKIVAPSSAPVKRRNAR